MTSADRTYLEWRFRVNNHSKYLKYMNDWINNLQLNQIVYFRRERINLINNGLYNG